jgi:hypothetical protein
MTDHRFSIASTSCCPGRSLLIGIPSTGSLHDSPTRTNRDQQAFRMRGQVDAAMQLVPVALILLGLLIAYFEPKFL